MESYCGMFLNVDSLAKTKLDLRLVGFFQTILKQDDEHFLALLGYALVMFDRKMYDESCKVALRLLIKDSSASVVSDVSFSVEF